MSPRVYLETTIPSYLTAWRSRDLIKAAHQEATREWWESRNRFELYISQVVMNEAARSDLKAAEQRLEVLTGIPILDVTEDAKALAKDLMKSGPLPKKAAVDALHIGVAAVHGMDFLLTWNCTHIANAATRGEIEAVCRKSELSPPTICTPLELMEA